MTSPSVKILATCRSPDLARMTTLVFETLRIGFPTANVTVYVNGDCRKNCPEIDSVCIQHKCQVKDDTTISHEWIRNLLACEKSPFFTLDTDVIFYENFENFTFEQAIAGFRVPEWQDEFSGCITRSRLHPSLMYFDPEQVEVKKQAMWSVCPDTPFTPRAVAVNPIIIPLNGRLYFHDTCSLLYHLIGGQPFTDDQKEAYFHFNFGTIPDLVLPRLANGKEMLEARKQVLENPQLGRGMWRAQEAYYAQRPPKPTAPIDLPKITFEDAKSAFEWNKELCKGNPEAMEMNDHWYRLCHGLDDLIDTMEDGHTRMSPEQILALWIDTALFYNCAWYVKNRTMLFPTVLTVTNQYADSVAWERSPIYRRRTMADVMRTCGNEMFFMVAMLCGGWEHARSLSGRIRERDWIGQHDKNDKPT